MALVYAAVVWPGEDAAERKAAAGYQHGQGDDLMHDDYVGPGNDYWERTYGMSEEEVELMRAEENEYYEEQRRKEEQHDE